MLQRCLTTALVVTAFVMGQVVCTAEKFPELAGEWQAYNAGSNQKLGLANIRHNGKELTFNNGTDKSKGEFVGKNKVKAFDWKLEATVSPDGKRLDWSNGTYWVKKGK
jgi:hypothetical protein